MSPIETKIDPELGWEDVLPGGGRMVNKQILKPGTTVKFGPILWRDGTGKVNMIGIEVYVEDPRTVVISGQGTVDTTYKVMERIQGKHITSKMEKLGIPVRCVRK